MIIRIDGSEDQIGEVIDCLAKSKDEKVRQEAARLEQEYFYDDELLLDLAGHE